MSKLNRDCRNSDDYTQPVVSRNPLIASQHAPLARSRKFLLVTIRCVLHIQQALRRSTSNTALSRHNVRTRNCDCRSSRSACPCAISRHLSPRHDRATTRLRATQLLVLFGTHTCRGLRWMQSCARPTLRHTCFGNTWAVSRTPSVAAMQVDYTAGPQLISRGQQKSGLGRTKGKQQI